MKSYIPKQPKQTRERIEARLDSRLVRDLEEYCQYLDSARDAVLAKVLEVAFRKDKGFSAWRAARNAAATASAPGPSLRETKPRFPIGGTD